MLILINVWKDFNFVLSCRASLEDRLKLEEHSGTSNMADSAVGSKQLTFKLQKVNFKVLINPKCIRFFLIKIIKNFKHNLLGKNCLWSHISLLNCVLHYEKMGTLNCLSKLSTSQKRNLPSSHVATLKNI